MAIAQSTQTHPITLPVGNWQIVPADSELGFATRILFGLIPVRGRYSGYSGVLDVDEAGNASGALRIEVATISTGIKKRDAHLRSGDFFAAHEHPHMRFELLALVPNEDGSQTLSGTLRIRDEVLPIHTPVSVSTVGPDRLRIDADLEVDHSASYLGWKRVPSPVRVQAALTLERVS